MRIRHVGVLASATLLLIAGQASAAATKIGVFRSGEWFLDKNGNGVWDNAVGGDIYIPSNQFGQPGDQPLVVSRGGSQKIAVFNSSGGQWWHDTSGGAYVPDYAWGTGDEYFSGFGQWGWAYLNDTPVTGEWYKPGVQPCQAGTGNTCVGVVRQTGSVYSWFLDRNGNYAWDGTGSGNDFLGTYGSWPAIPVAGKMTGGVTQIGVFSGGTWKFDTNSSLTEDTGDLVITGFGQSGDWAFVGNWSGSGTSDCIGVFNAGNWWLDYNCNRVWDAGDRFYSFGQSGDRPVVGTWP